MAPLITLYILGGCVAVAAVLFIVMIVLTALRPPPLPDVSIAPPLQRMFRALTPLPIAAPAPANVFDPDATTLRRRPAPVAARSLAQPPAAARSLAHPPVAARSVAHPPVASPRSRPAGAVPPAYRPPPGVLAQRPPVVAPPKPPRPWVMATPAAVFAPQPVLPAPAFVPPPRVVPQPGARPAYRRRHLRTLARLVLVMVSTVIVVGGVVVAHPALLDPLCDYDWSGADAMQLVRQHARDAHAAIAELIATL